MPAPPKIDFKESSWNKAKPKDVKGAKLGSKIKEAEKAQANEKKKKNDGAAIQATLTAMEECQAAAQETIKKECDAKKHKDLITALKKFTGECQSEIKRLQDALKKADGAAADDDGDVSDNDLLTEKHLKQCLKKAKTKTSALDGVSFVFSVAKKPEDCKLVLHKKKNFSTQLWRRFQKLVKEDNTLKSAGHKKNWMAYGGCYQSGADSATLVLQLDVEANSKIPGMDKKARKWMLQNKESMVPFKKLELLASNGQPLVSPPETDGDQADADTIEPPNIPNLDGQTQDVAPGDGQGQTQEVQPNEGQPETQEVRPGEGQPETQTTPPQGEEAIENRRNEFKKMRRAWQTVKEKAIQDLEAVKDGIRDYYLDDPEQFKVATGKLSELDKIMDNLNDDLRDVLDKYVSTPKNRQAELERLGAEAKQVIDRFLDFTSKDKLINAIDQKEFADVTVKAPVESALKSLGKTITA